MALLHYNDDRHVSHKSDHILMMLDTNLDFAKETNLARLLESRCRMLSNVI